MKKFILMILVIFSKSVLAQTPAEIPTPVFFKLPYNEMKEGIQSRQQQYDKYQRQQEIQEEQEYRKIQKCKKDIISQLNSYKYVKSPVDGMFNVYAFTEDMCDIRKVNIMDKRVMLYICGDGVLGEVIFSQEISNGYTRIKIRRQDDNDEYFVELYFPDLFTNYQ